MKLRSITAAAMAAGVLTLGGTGVALADAAPAPVPAAATATATAKCVKAPAALTHLQDMLKKLDQRVVNLQKRDAVAKAHHQDDRAKAIEARIDKAHTAHQRAADRMAAIEKRCNLPAPTAPAAVPGA